MGKSDLIDKIRKDTGLTKAASAECVNNVLNAIADVLKEGENVVLPGFGTFEVKEVPEHMGRNPQTGQPMTIKAHKRVKFKPSGLLTVK